MDQSDDQSGCDTQSINENTSHDTQSVIFEGTSKDTQSVQSDMHGIQRNMSAMLSVVQQMAIAWANHANKRQRCDSDSDSNSPPQKSHTSDDLDDLADLFNNANKSGDDDNWDLLDDIEDLNGDDEKGPPIKDKFAQNVNDRFRGNLGSETI